MVKTSEERVLDPEFGVTSYCSDCDLSLNIDTANSQFVLEGPLAK